MLALEFDQVGDVALRTAVMIAPGTRGGDQHAAGAEAGEEFIGASDGAEGDDAVAGGKVEAAGHPPDGLMEAARAKLRLEAVVLFAKNENLCA
jgi:hypothetical protein